MDVVHTNWRGFIPHAYDTKIMSSYVDENYANGLKENSKRYLGYEQQTYKEVTTKRGLLDDLPKGGKVIATERNEDGNEIVTKQYRMNELTAAEVFSYGCDDTICTAALFNFYRMNMELEKTFHVYEQVEITPAYMGAKGFVDGVKVSIERLRELEKEDDKVFEEARTILSRTLLEQGIIDAMWEPYTDNRCADFKDAFEAMYGYHIESKVRTHSKLADDMRSNPDLNQNTAMMAFASAVEGKDMDWVNKLLLAKYKDDPVIDMNSPKQMKKFLYDVLKLPVRVVAKATPLEKKNQPALAQAIFKYTKLAMEGKEREPNAMSPEEWALLKEKAKTNEVAVNMALLYDAADHVKVILQAMQDMKTILTRRSFYYYKYPYMKHWKDGLVHSSMNQCATVTRRYSSSGPNLQQLPKKGEGVKIREMIVAHHRKAVVVSLDFSGQELRLGADYSRDENFLACYVGDNLKDPHSITAAGSMHFKWGKAKVEELVQKVVDARINFSTDYDLFVAIHKRLQDKVANKLADDLRKKSKNVNFLSQYDGQALTLSYQMLTPVHECQQFLDAREKMFPRVSVWKEEVRKEVMSCGYATTMLGARRHLSKLMMDRATANKAGRQGPNFKIQGSAAEMTKLAMARIWDSGVLYDYDCRFIAPVHDELVFSIHADHVVDAVRIIYACMTAQYADMIVPIESSISLGKNFGEQIECGEGGFNEKAINDALYEVFGEKVAA